MTPAEWKLEPGDRLETAAYRLGVAPQTLWMDPSNEKLRDERGDPGHLQPSDVLCAPEKKPRREPANPGMIVRFRRKHAPAWLRIQMWIDDTPRSSAHCTVVVDGMLVRLFLDEAGSVDCPVPLTAKKATLSVLYGDRTPDVEIDLKEPEFETELEVEKTVLRIRAEMLYSKPDSAATSEAAEPPPQ